MTDPNGKTVVMTGATSGIGQATAIALAQQGARVLAVGRDRARGEALLNEITRSGGRGDFLYADLLSLKDVARLADQVKALTPSVDVIFNNAGGVFGARTMSADGIEATFALNTVAAFALTDRLHGALAQAGGRVVNVVTGFLERIQLNVEALVNPPSYSSFGRYAQAKLASIMMTLEQAERWKHDGIRATAVQPGIVLGTRFGGWEPSGPSIWQTMGAAVMQRMGIGATMAQAVERYRLAAFGDMATGTYFAWGKMVAIPRQAQDAGTRAAVWQLLETLTRA
jgi:NAD(P)-dependent dehydrogenase (short-subunit alcohol dehydrogenase family)